MGRRKLSTLTVEDIAAVRRILRNRDRPPFETALFEWVYTNGARAAEPGLALMEHLDMRSRRVMLVHLKGGLEPTPIALAKTCHAALEKWLPLRPIVHPKQDAYVFPSQAPGHCYTCKSSGKRLTNSGDLKPCHHCNATGQRWGISRYEVAAVIGELLEAAGLPVHLRYPHLLRHSLCTHLLDAGWSPADIRLRVGHASVETTFMYMQATKKAHDELDNALGGLDNDDE